MSRVRYEKFKRIPSTTKTFELRWKKYLFIIFSILRCMKNSIQLRRRENSYSRLFNLKKVTNQNWLSNSVRKIKCRIRFHDVYWTFRINNRWILCCSHSSLQKHVFWVKKTFKLKVIACFYDTTKPLGIKRKFKVWKRKKVFMVSINKSLQKITWYCDFQSRWFKVL